jgi:trigger factor
LQGRSEKEEEDPTVPIIEQEDTGACTKTLSIEIPLEKLREETDEIYKELKEHADVPGFRKGRAPRPVLEMRFGRVVAEQSQNQAVEKAWEEAAKELELKVVGDPNVHDLETEEEKPIRFKVDLQFVPKVELRPYESLELEVPRPTVTDVMVSSALENLRQRYASLATVEGRPVQDGDLAAGDIEATVDGEPFPEATQKGYRLQVGRGVLLPGFDEALRGKNAGDKVEVDVELPEDYSIEKYRGKTAHFAVVIQSIHERKLPDLDDEFAKDMGRFESLDDLRAQVRRDMAARAEAEKEPRIEAALRDRLLADNAFEVPPVLLEGEQTYVNALQNLRLIEMGTSFPALEKEQQEELRATGRETAERRTRLSLILQQIAEEKEIKLDDEEFEDYVEAAAESEGMDPGRFRINMENRGLVPYYYRLALEEKVMRFLQDQAKVTWVEPDEGGEEEATAEDATPDQEQAAPEKKTSRKKATGTRAESKKKTASDGGEEADQNDSDRSALT